MILFQPLDIYCREHYKLQSMQHFVVVEDVLSDTDDEKLNTPVAAVVEDLSSSTWSPPKVSQASYRRRLDLSLCITSVHDATFIRISIG
eukprot:scaffold39586_cov59-Cyclotella_meneghiniana.AAC.1